MTQTIGQVAAEVEERIARAETIQQQLGGRMFTMMTGARGYAATERGLRFRIGAGAHDGINLVSIELNPRDLYDVTFHRMRGAKLHVVAQYEDVYDDQLRRIFESQTGFRVSL